MAIKKSELYSSLWASCDELRGWCRFACQAACKWARHGAIVDQGLALCIDHIVIVNFDLIINSQVNLFSQNLIF